MALTLDDIAARLDAIERKVDRLYPGGGEGEPPREFAGLKEYLDDLAARTGEIKQLLTGQPRVMTGKFGDDIATVTSFGYGVAVSPPTVRYVPDPFTGKTRGDRHVGESAD